VLEHFQSDQLLEGFLPMHLWFIYYLLLCYLLLTPLLLVGRRLAGGKLGRASVALFRRHLCLPGGVLLRALLTVPLLYPMRYWLPDTPYVWTPQLHILAYYLAFFLFGWLLGSQRDLLPTLGRGWKAQLPVGIGLVLPLLLGLTVAGLTLLKERPAALPPYFGALKFAALFCGALYTWLMIGGLSGLFRAWLPRERAWVRYLADASYWCYLMSIPPLVALEILVARWPLPVILKVFLVNSLTLAVLLASYHLLVRSTAVGRLLHGRKPREESASSAP
jgi:peptidoglycan/LPS O-acetylase OafA/YrhL